MSESQPGSHGNAQRSLSNQPPNSAGPHGTRITSNTSSPFWTERNKFRCDCPAPKPPTRLERQQDVGVEAMLADLPTACDTGAKRNSKNNVEYWIGYKLHLDSADGQIPISFVLTSASRHDSQGALPLAEMTAQRVSNLYDVMDAAYDCAIIRQHSQSLGHTPLIDRNFKADHKAKAKAEHEAETAYSDDRATRFQQSSTFAFTLLFVYNRTHQDENHSANSCDGSIRGLDKMNNAGYNSSGY